MTSYYRCETEEKNTKCLEQQVVLLRQSKRNADQSCMKLQADLRHSMAELQEMHQEFEVNKCTANAEKDNRGVSRVLNTASTHLLLLLCVKGDVIS